MTAPADGVDRLIHFVDARMARLGLSRQDVARRGGPGVDTLSKVRYRHSTQHTPIVGMLLRLGGARGWEAGSSAVVPAGGSPLSVSAKSSRRQRRRGTKASEPMTDREILQRLVSRFRDEIARLEGDRDAIEQRLARMRTLCERFAAELDIDDELVKDYAAADADAAAG
jgi:hypothetical protein